MGTRYHNGLVGDSPEWCALDAHLFSDMEDALTFNLALSSTYHKVGDPKWLLPLHTSAPADA